MHVGGLVTSLSILFFSMLLPVVLAFPLCVKVFTYLASTVSFLQVFVGITIAEVVSFAWLCGSLHGTLQKHGHVIIAR